MNIHPTMSEDKRFALRAVIASGLGLTAICCELEAFRFYNLRSWYRYYQLAKTIREFTRWLQKLAFYSAINFEGFDEEFFWQEYKFLCKKFPNNPFIMIKQFYEQNLQRIKVKK